MKKYPSIEQFRNVIRTVKSKHDFQGKDDNGDAIYKHLSDYPTLTFEGTVKLHGTNAAIVQYKDRREYQSRERVLSLEQDNAGFMLYMSGLKLDYLFKDIPFNDYIAIYGEWCGGNIQKGVAITGLPKMFVIFGYLVDDIWVDIPNIECGYSIHAGIYNVDRFPTFTVDIDFNQPEAIQNELIRLTIAVEEKCPVGAYFNVEGIGEGIVFTCTTDPTLKFKSKGEKHSASKVKVLNTVNTEELESIREFVEYSCTLNRMEQGLQYLRDNGFPIHQTAIGDFIRWIVTDILKEESDTIINNQIDIKKAKGQIAFKAKQWFINQI